MIPVLFDFETSRVGRHPGAQFREVGDEIFLVHPDGEQIYNLNPMAAALWRLLKNPMTGRAMAEVVITAFPMLAMAKVEGDVKAVLTELLAKGFARLLS
ncbi:MAG: PqqD family protein [Rhodospirillales bacterium]|nr:PqqD family protein [Rhodospirillales bacterium]